MLYICATPIGNIEDITLRVLRILKEVDHVIAEDTRHTRKLLSHYQIQTSLISMHQHNEAERTEQVIELIKQGKTLALVSDAGCLVFLIRRALGAADDRGKSSVYGTSWG